MCTRENTQSFFDLQSMLLIEESHAAASTSTHTDNKMLYTEGDKPSRRGGQGGSVRNGGGRWDQGKKHRSDADSNPEPSGKRGCRGDQNRQGKSAAECWYCGKKGHKESECWKKRADSERPVPDTVLEMPRQEIGSDHTTPKIPEMPEKGQPS